MRKEKDFFSIESDFDPTENTKKRKINKKEYFKKIMKLLLIMIIGLFFFINFIKVINKTDNNFYSVFRNFSSEIFSKGPTGFLYDWFTIKKGDAVFSEKEEMISYQLRLLTKMLNGYFKNLLLRTDKLVAKFKNNDFITFIKKGKFSGQYYYKEIRTNIKDYLLRNKDVIASYLFTLNGQVVTGAKYKKVKPIQLDQKMILETVSNKNILLKYDKYVLLLSSINYKNQPTSIFCQLLNPIFFSQILANLEISDNIFYLKNQNNEIVIHNYESQKYINANKNKVISDLFYRSFTKNKENELAIKINKMDFKISSIIRENNFWGYTISLLFFIMMLLASIYLVNFSFSFIKKLIIKKKNKDLLGL